MYCTAIHAFIAFLHFPADGVYDAVNHKGEQILTVVVFLKGVWGK